jgi:hypothetical protein
MNDESRGVIDWARLENELDSQGSASSKTWYRPMTARRSRACIRMTRASAAAW